MRSYLAYGAAGILLAAPASAQWKAGEPLAREGARLVYDGRPFAAVGVNKHELLDQYLARQLGASEADAAKARAAARESLLRLKDLGITVARVRLSAFYPAQMERSFLSEDAGVRNASWTAMDAMLDDCDRAGIRIVATLAWNLAGWADLKHETLSDLFADPSSASRQALCSWIRDVVAHCRRRDTILFWELFNEANLGADLAPQFPEGLMPKPVGETSHLFRGPVVRDGRNNYTSEELAALTRELCRLVKATDPARLVGTGNASPRPAAWHLWMGSLRRSKEMDWTTDTPEEQADYLRLITPKEVDLVSLHTYGEPLESVLVLKRAADSIGTPVYVGETGMAPDSFGEPVYDHPKAVQGLELTLAGMRDIGIPLVLPWTWDEWGEPVHEPVLRPQTQPAVVAVLRRANELARDHAGKPALSADEVAASVRDCDVRIRALIPAK